MILPFAGHASHPVFLGNMLGIKSHHGCLHREARKQPKSNVVTTALLQGKEIGRKGGRQEKEHRSFI